MQSPGFNPLQSINGVWWCIPVAPVLRRWRRTLWNWRASVTLGYVGEFTTSLGCLRLKTATRIQMFCSGFTILVWGPAVGTLQWGLSSGDLQWGSYSGNLQWGPTMGTLPVRFFPICFLSLGNQEDKQLFFIWSRITHKSFLSTFFYIK